MTDESSKYRSGEMETEVHVHVCDRLGPVLVDMVLQPGTLDHSTYSGKARPTLHTAYQATYMYIWQTLKQCLSSPARVSRDSRLCADSIKAPSCSAKPKKSLA